MATQDQNGHKDDSEGGFDGPGEEGLDSGTSLFDSPQPKRNQWERVNKGKLDETPPPNPPGKPDEDKR